MIGQLDEAHADLLGEGGDELGLAEHALVDEHSAECAPARCCSAWAIANWS